MNQTFGFQLYRSIEQLAQTKSDPILQSILTTRSALTSEQVDYLYSISEIKTLFDLNQSFKGNESLIKEYIRTFPFGKITAFQQNNQSEYLLQFLKEYDDAQNLNLEVNNLNLTLENATSQINQLQNQNLAIQSNAQTVSKLAAIQELELLSNQELASQGLQINVRTSSQPESSELVNDNPYSDTSNIGTYSESVLEESTKQDKSLSSKPNASIQQNKQQASQLNQQRQSQLAQQNINVAQKNNLSQNQNPRKNNLLGKAALASAFGASSLFGGSVIFDILL